MVKSDPHEAFEGMAGGCSWTKNWLTFDNSYYELGMQYNVHSGDSRLGPGSNSTNVHGSGYGDANTTVYSSARKEKKINTANRRDNNNRSGDGAGGNSRNNSVDDSGGSASTSANMSPFFSVSGKPDDLMWLPTDEALKESPEFSKYFLR